MTQIHWTNAVDGLFSDAADWGGGTVPGAGDTAILDAAGASPYTVTAASSETVGAIKTASNATLDITGGTFSATGTMSGVNAGAIIVGDNSMFTVGGKLRNTGSITIGDNAYVNGPEGGTSSIKNSGTLIRSGGTGFSDIAIAIVDTGSIVAAGGNLVLLAAISGTGSLMVDSGARLYVSNTAATLSMVFSGPDAVVDLSAKTFRATINGFAPTDAIDLGGKKATSAVLEAGDKLVITNGTKAVGTLQLAGDYTGDTFNLTSDGNGGTNITVSTPAVAPPAATALPFVAAMAGLRGSAGGSVHTSGPWPVHEPLLVRPRAATA